MLDTLPRHDVRLPPGTDEAAINRRFGAEIATRIEDHEIDSVHTHVDALDRCHVLTVLKRTYSSRSPFTCETEWPGGRKTRNNGHKSTAIAALTDSLKEINEQAAEDAKALMALAATPAHGATDGEPPKSWAEANGIDREWMNADALEQEGK